MIDHGIKVVAVVNTQSPEKVENILTELVGANSISRTESGFLIRTTMHGQRATETNRALLSALRGVDNGLTLESEWTDDGVTAKFSDFVLKGIEEAHVSI